MIQRGKNARIKPNKTKRKRKREATKSVKEKKDIDTLLWKGVGSYFKQSVNMQTQDMRK